MSYHRSSPQPDMPKTVFGFGSSAPRYCNKPIKSPSSPAKPVRPASPSRPHRAHSPSRSSPNQADTLTRPLARPAFGSTGARLAPTTPSPVKPRPSYSRTAVADALSETRPVTMRWSSSPAGLRDSLRRSGGGGEFLPAHMYGYDHNEYVVEKHVETPRRAEPPVPHVEGEEEERDEEVVRGTAALALALAVDEPAAVEKSVAKEEPIAVVKESVAAAAVTEPAEKPVAEQAVPEAVTEPAAVLSVDKEALAVAHKILFSEKNAVSAELDFSSPSLSSLLQSVAQYERGAAAQDSLAAEIILSLYRERAPHNAEDKEQCEVQVKRVEGDLFGVDPAEMLLSESADDKTDEGDDRTDTTLHQSDTQAVKGGEAVFSATVAAKGVEAASATIAFDAAAQTIAVREFCLADAQ